jgi:hypothetical protein
MKYWYNIILGIIIGVGVLLRLWWFYDARSLFLDEANLALNIAERSYTDFFYPLKYQQYAPPLFVCVVKACTGLSGLNELALRLPSLVVGLISLGLFYHLLGRLLANPFARLFPLLLFATSTFLIRYSTELKQYSFDVAIVLLLISIALRWSLNDLNLGRWLLWALVGSISIWFSMPVVFVLFSVGAYYFWQLLKEQQYQSLFPLALVSAFWLLSFGLLYYQVLSPSLGEVHLINHHTPYFFPVNIFTIDAWIQIWVIIRGLLAPVIGYTAVALILGLALLIWGGYRFFKQRIDYFILLILPVVSCFIASAMEQFSLMPRVSLFIMPLLLLFIGIGVDKLFSLLGGKWQVLVFIVLTVIVQPVWQSVGTLGQTTEIEDIKAVILWTKSKSTTTFVHHEAVPAFRFYTEYHDDRLQYDQEAVLVPWSQSFAEVFPLHSSSSFVLLHSHLLSKASKAFEKRWVSDAQAIGALKDSITSTGAAAYYFEKK